MELFIFGFISLLVAGIVTFILALYLFPSKERIKADQNLIAGNLEEAFDNLQIYSNTENINSSYKTIHFLCKHCKNDVSINFQFLDLSVIENVNFTVKCPLCGKKVVTGKVKDGVIYFF